MNHPKLPASSAEWRRQVAEIHILNRYLIETVRLQLTEAAVRQNAPANRLLAEIHAQLLRHNRELNKTLPVELQELHQPSASLAEVFVHFFRKARAHAVSCILRNDLVLFTLAAGNCSLLHAASLALGQAEAADLALAQLRTLSGLNQRITQLLPAVAIADSCARFGGAQEEVARAASANVSEAWGFAPAEAPAILRAS